MYVCMYVWKNEWMKERNKQTNNEWKKEKDKLKKNFYYFKKKEEGGDISHS